MSGFTPTVADLEAFCAQHGGRAPRDNELKKFVMKRSGKQSQHSHRELQREHSPRHRQ